MLGKLAKLRGKGWQELQIRGAQELARQSERYLGGGTRELSDRAFLRAWLLPSDTTQAAATALIERLQQPEQQCFFPALAQRSAVVALMESRFASERAELIARAERVVGQRFDIFEHEGMRFSAASDGTVDWSFEPTSGKRTPLAHWSAIDFLDPAIAGDKKFTWELNRHQFFVTLGQAYWLTGDEKYAEQFVALASAWLDANPPKRGINWASSLELSFRVIAWLWALHFFAEAKALTPEFVARVLKSLIAQGRHIETYLSHYFSPNTHLTGEALGLFYLGTALPELRQAEHWRQYGRQILLEQLPLHVRDDGVYFEQASYYHRYTTDFYTHLLLLSRASGNILPDMVTEKLSGLHEHLCWITRPDGSSTFYGDDDGGRLVMLSTRRAADFRDALATGATLLKRGDWKFVAGAAAVETLWLLGAEGLQAFDQLEAQAPSTLKRAFPASGFYVMRDGWERDDSYLFVDCGLHSVMNGGHAHSDALAFEYSAGGATWLVDPGTFSYTGDLQRRNEIRCSQNHNTVSVDGLSQSTPNTAFTWTQTARCLAREFSESDEAFFFAGQQDGYSRLADPVRQQRSWRLSKTALDAKTPRHLLVTDRFDAKGSHQYQWHWHLAAGCQVMVTGKLARVVAPTGQELMLAARVNSPEEWQFVVTEDWVSPCYGQRKAAPVITLELAASGALSVETLFVPLLNERANEFVQRWF